MAIKAETVTNFVGVGLKLFGLSPASAALDGIKLLANGIGEANRERATRRLLILLENLHHSMGYDNADGTIEELEKICDNEESRDILLDTFESLRTMIDDSLIENISRLVCEYAVNNKKRPDYQFKIFSNLLCFMNKKDKEKMEKIVEEIEKESWINFNDYTHIMISASPGGSVRFIRTNMAIKLQSDTRNITGDFHEISHIIDLLKTSGVARDFSSKKELRYQNLIQITFSM